MSPSEVLENVISAGIEVASITDHETAGGYLAVRDEVPEQVRLIFGVEFSTCHREAPEGVSKCGREIHILGYFPGGFTGKIQAYLKELQQERLNRARVALTRLRRAGCKIAFDALMEHVKGDCISRAHMARALVANGLASSIYDAFNRYLDISRGIVPPPLLSPKRVITFIISEGGIPVWAHPRVEDFDLLVKEFVDYGLKGVEICGGKRAENYSLYFERTARVLGLLVTYGSDWHGLGKEKLEGITVPYESIAEFLEMFETKRS